MNYAEDEKIIDLKQLLYYVLKRWKQIFIFLMIGVLLGSGFSLLRGQKTLDDLSSDDIEALNTKKILQYNRVQELYELQKETNAKSIILQLDPNQVYRTYRSYYLTVPISDANLISERFYAISSDSAVLDELIAASGYECDHRVIKELFSLSFSTIDSSTVWGQYGLTPLHVKVSLSAMGPNEEIGEAVLNVLDSHVVALFDTLDGECSNFEYNKLDESNQFGYDSGVRSSQESATDTLREYENEIIALEKELTDNDMFYYTWTYEPEEIEFSLLKQTIKFSILFGALFCILACGCYGVLFLLDDHIKTAHEVIDYGLYTIACIHTGDETKQDMIDKLFSSGKLPTNSKEYLLNALRTLCTGKTVLCGDKQDAMAAEVMNWLASQMDELCVTDSLAKDENGLITAKESDGAILFVRLWKTTVFDLKRELYVMKQIEKPVKGVVVLRG